MSCKNYLFTCALLLLLSCTKTDSGSSSNASPNSSGTGCGTYNGHSLYKGPDGGCYYINSNGNKVYVDRNKCRC
jgi:hypothetical protein